MTEKIAAAAIRVGNEIYTATTHFAVSARIIALPDRDQAVLADQLMDGEYGFVTTEGRFVTRTEAFKIAAAAGQIQHSELADPAKNMDFYGTPRPSLDSGMIVEHYAPLRVRPANIY